MNEDKTDPNWRTRLADGTETAAKSIWAWSVTHTVAATGIGAFVAGWIVGKVW